MRLSKLYSNNKDFKLVEFKEGLNVIVGYGDKLSSNDSHNLGKTSVLKLVDYMLLKDTAKSKDHFFNTKKEFFQNYEFYLEIELNSKKYITIKRSVKDKKIAIKIHEIKYQNYVNEKIWDFENLTLSKGKEKLNELFLFDLKSNYRKFLKFILRTQKEYNFKFKKDEVKDIDWKPYIMELFGYELNSYKELFHLKNDKEKLRQQLSDYKNSDFVKLDEKRNIKEIYEEKIRELEKKVKAFDYYTIDENVNDDLIKEINKNISILNKKKYNLSFDIENIKKSLNTGINTLDMQDIEDIYKEVKLYFSNSLKEDYKSLVEFNKQISQERKITLSKNLKEKENELENLNKSLEEENQKQKKAFEILEANKTIEKILLHNNELNNYKIKYAELSKELEIMESNINKNKELKSKMKEIDELNDKIYQEISEEKNELKKYICNNFIELTKEIFFDSEGRISIYTNNEGVPEMDMKLYSIASGAVTAEDEGTNYNKHMKCCFDLAIILGYLKDKKRYFDFAFHDGSIEASDNKLKIAFLDLINKLCKDYEIQYITTTIYDEISDKDVFSKIGDKNIILKLTDSEDYSGTLFGKRF